MKRKFWIVLTLLVVVPGFMFTVACQKRVAVQQPEVVEEEPVVVVEEKEEVVVVPPPTKMDDMVMKEDVYFDFDKSNLKPAAQESLLQKTDWLRENSDVTVTIEGHCDERGTNEYNLALGDRRAFSAKSFLADLGMDDSRLTTVSYGEERPIDSRADEDAWAKNRRAHFVIKE